MRQILFECLIKHLINHHINQSQYDRIITTIKYIFDRQPNLMNPSFGLSSQCGDLWSYIFTWTINYNALTMEFFLCGNMEVYYHPSPPEEEIKLFEKCTQAQLEENFDRLFKHFVKQDVNNQ